jgi:hypothetical protein
MHEHRLAMYITGKNVDHELVSGRHIILLNPDTAHGVSASITNVSAIPCKFNLCKHYKTRKILFFPGSEQESKNNV